MACETKIIETRVSKNENKIRFYKNIHKEFIQTNNRRS